jgi:hypothetical protein
MVTKSWTLSPMSKPGTKNGCPRNHFPYQKGKYATYQNSGIKTLPLNLFYAISSTLRYTDFIVIKCLLNNFVPLDLYKVIHILCVVCVRCGISKTFTKRSSFWPSWSASVILFQPDFHTFYKIWIQSVLLTWYVVFIPCEMWTEKILALKDTQSGHESHNTPI